MQKWIVIIYKTKQKLETKRKKLKSKKNKWKVGKINF